MYYMDTMYYIQAFFMGYPPKIPTALFQNYLLSVTSLLKKQAIKQIP